MKTSMINRLGYENRLRHVGGGASLTFTNILIVALITLVIFSFKWQIFGVGENGVRVDDIAIVLLFALTVTDVRAVDFSWPVLRVYAVFVAYSLFCSLYGGLTGKVDLVISTLFSARLLEYLLFYFVGLSVYRRGLSRYVWATLRIYVIFLTVIIPLQMVGIIPVTSGFSGAVRAIGNTNGPYELAAISAGLTLLYLYTGRMAYFWVTAIICFAAAARITSIILILIILLNFRNVVRNHIVALLNFKVALLVFALFAAGISVSLTRANITVGTDESVSLLDRLQEINPTEFYERLSDSYDSAQPYGSSRDYQNNAFEDAIFSAIEQNGDDVSGLIRAYRWATLLKTTFQFPSTTLFGMGPSFGTSAVDGYYVRLIVETGLVGLVIFLIWVGTVMLDRKYPPWLREYLFILSATAIFIDIFVSFKPMLFLWLFLGMVSASLGNRKQQ